MLDTSHWLKDEKSQASGTRTKFWLIDPNSTTHEEKHLFKVPNAGTGGHWAEFIASKLGEQLGFKTTKVEFAIHENIVGTISKNFRNETEEFYEGGDLFSAYFQNFDRYSLNLYELPNILRILSVYNLDQDFITIPIFDALIANNDRHCDNWGVLRDMRDTRLAPIYDNGSSLGFNVTLDQKRKMLTDNRMLEAFCNRGKSSIGLPNRKKPKHFELLSLIRKQMPDQFHSSIRKIESLNDEMIHSILHQIPKEIMCELNKSWMNRLLLYRKQWILNWMKGE